MNKLLIAAAMVIIVVINSNVLGLAQQVPIPVLDLNGNPLIAGKQYLMMIANGAATIGVARINGTCALYIGEQPNPNPNPNLGKFFAVFSNNLGPLFTQISSTIQTMRIHERTPVSIKFASNLEFCPQWPVWQVVRNVIRTGGKQTKFLFQIVIIALKNRTPYPVYKLQFCPFEVQKCQDIGILPGLIDNLPGVPTGPLLTTFIQGQNISPLFIQFKLYNTE